MNISTEKQYQRLAESDEYYEELCRFLDTGGDPNQIVEESSTLLHVAAQSDKPNISVVHKLINSGADVDLVDNSGNTPLIFAVMSRNLVAVSMLLKAGAEVNVGNCFGTTALHYAIQCYNPKDKQPGIDNTVPNYRKSKKIKHKRNSADIWILKELLKNGDIDVNPVNFKGGTPLTWAVKQKNHGAVRELLRKGANPNLLSQTGQNSLHLVAPPKYRNFDIVFELLQYGAGIYHKDKFGQTAIDYILQSNVDDSFRSASQYLLMIALKYRIKEDLEHKVADIPKLKALLSGARKEVEWMHEEIIYDKVTLHDIVNGCFQERGVADSTSDIYLPVVNILLTGKYSLYFNSILQAIPKLKLRDVLDNLVHSFPQIVGPVINPRSLDLTHLEIFEFIRNCYDQIHNL